MRFSSFVIFSIFIFLSVTKCENILEITQSISWDRLYLVWRRGAENILRFRLHEKFMDPRQLGPNPMEKNFKIDSIVFLKLNDGLRIPVRWIDGATINEMEGEFSEFDNQNGFVIYPSSEFKYNGLVKDFGVSFDLFNELPRFGSYAFGIGLIDDWGNKFYYFAGNVFIGSSPVWADGPYFVRHNIQVPGGPYYSLQHESLLIANNYAHDFAFNNARHIGRKVPGFNPLFPYLSLAEIEDIRRTDRAIETTMARSLLEIRSAFSPQPRSSRSAEYVTVVQYKEICDDLAAKRTDLDLCAICLEHLGSSDKIISEAVEDQNSIAKTKCCHFFHKKCFDRMHDNYRFCPKCRTDLA